MQRLPRLGLGGRAPAAADDSANALIAVSGQEGDEPLFIVLSVVPTALAITAAQQAGRARIAAYIRRNIDQDVAQKVINDTQGAQASGDEIIFDQEVGITAAAASPHILPLAGVVFEDGDSLVVEGGKGVDNTGAGFAVTWGITVMGKRKRQRRDNTR